MPMSLTPKQKDVLNYIVEYTHEHEYAPSYREIASALRLASPSTVHVHVQALRQRGYLQEGDADRGNRDLVPTDRAVRWGRSVLLPLKGMITAGQPIEAIEEHETLAVPVELVPKSDQAYVLKVRGQSMIDEGILDGDYVVIEPCPTPKNGDVVVALIERAEVTLKKFFKERDRVRLQPANKTMEPIYCKNPLIQGVVRGLIRTFPLR